MPLRPAARWQWAVKNGANAPSEAIWVTDQILSRTFQRFLDVSRANRRAVSSVPGPMYHRMRFGKRRMTELNSFQHYGALPAWMLPEAPDLTKWHWQPPKPELWAPPPEPPKIVAVSVDPPAEPSFEPSVKLPSEPPENLEARLEKSIQPTVINMEVQPWHDFTEQLVDIHKADCKTVEEFGAHLKTFVRRFKKAVSKGRLTGPATADIYTLASRQLEIACWKFGPSNFPKLQQLQLYLMSATCSGIRSVEEVDCTFCIAAPYFWEYMLEQWTKIEASVETAHLFTFILNRIRPRRLWKTSDLMVTGFKNFFQLWREAEPHGEPECWDQDGIATTMYAVNAWSKRVDRLLQQIQSDLAENQLEAARFRLSLTEKCVDRLQRSAMKAAHLMSDDQQITDVIADGLKDWRPARRGILFARVTGLLGKTKSYLTRVHYNWLQILVRMKDIDKRRFKQLLQRFAPRGHAALSDTELGHIMLLHWQTHGMLKDMGWTSRLWRNIRSEKDFTVLAALALAINRTNPPSACTAIFRDLWGFLVIRGWKKPFIRQVSLLSVHQKLSSNFLKRLAWTSNDPRVALLLHDVLVHRTGMYQQYWWPQFWNKFADLLCTDKYKNSRLNPIQLAHGLLGRKAERQPLERMQQNAPERRQLQCSTSKCLEHDDENKLDVVESHPSDHGPTASNSPGHDNQAQQWAEQIERIKKGLHIISQSPVLSDSQAIRQVSIFTTALAKKQGHLSTQDLQALGSVIIRFLNLGKCGPIQRLQRYLELVYDHLGPDVCYEVGMIMKRRRDENWRRWQLEVRKARKQSMQLQIHRQLKPLWAAYIGRSRRGSKRLAVDTQKARRVPQSSQLSHEQEQADEISLGARPSDGSGRTSNGDAFDALLAAASREEIVDREASF